MSDDRPLQVYRRLVGYASGYRRRLALIMPMLAVITAANLAIPWIVKSFFRDAVLMQKREDVHGYLLLILGVTVSLAATRWLIDDQIGLMSRRIVETIRDDLVTRLLRLPITYYVHGRRGDVVSRVITDAGLLQGFLHTAVVSVAVDALTALGAVAFIFYLNWKLALITLVVAPVPPAIVALTGPAIRRWATRSQETMSEMTSVVTEQTGAIPAIQAFGGVEHERQRFARWAVENRHASTNTARLQSGAGAAVNLLSTTGVVFLVGLAFGDVMALAAPGGGVFGLDHLLGFALYAALALDPLTRLSRTHLALQATLASGRRVVALLDTPEERSVRTRPLPSPVRGQLRFESAGFSYRSGAPVLADIDITIEAGELVALVGRSGAGKTTLAHLVLGFYEPSRGRVLLDGHDLASLHRPDLRAQIGWVGQEPFLFRGTVAENIMYGSWDASRAAVEEAARLACADGFIRALPQGYDSRIGEHGVTLSGGQRVRLALARVILRSPPLVVLDEFTAAMDTELEARLWKELEGWMSRRTVLVIAHRLYTVLTCPRLVVLDAGHVVGDGSAAALLETCPTFISLFREQLEASARVSRGEGAGPTAGTDEDAVLPLFPPADPRPGGESTAS
jgi:subfamily B ATP-binding cassette protein MsbA